MSLTYYVSNTHINISYPKHHELFIFVKGTDQIKLYKSHEKKNEKRYPRVIKS